MQTRRDQLHAYRFLTKRALAALVAGEPNVVEPPMRRLTMTTVSGIMIAILVAAGFAVAGFFKPSAGESWKDAGTIVIERETGARYIYRAGKLDPVLNYSSGVLAVAGASSGAGNAAKVVQVDQDEIASTPRGPTIGIDGIPDSLPPSGDIITSPFIVCSRQKPSSATSLTAAVSLSIGSDLVHPKPLGAGDGVLVVAPSDPAATYLLYRGKRYRVGSAAIAPALQFQDPTPLTVGTAFLQSLDQGPELIAPKITDLGKPGPKVDSRKTVIGQLLHSDSTDQFSIVLADGLETVTAFEAAVLSTLHVPGQVTVSSNALNAATQSKTLGPALADGPFQGLPTDLPSISTKPRELGDICATFGDDPAAAPSLGVVSSQLPNFQVSTVRESSTSQGGRADSVDVSPGHAALVKSSDNSPTVFAVAEPGKRYAFASAGLLSAFGYGDRKPTTLPGQLVDLVPTGPALDPSAALTPVTG